LTLATLPGWDNSGEVTEVGSLAPLAALPQPSELDLFGVGPADNVSTTCSAARY
jgi:hypothetical protein